MHCLCIIKDKLNVKTSVCYLLNKVATCIAVYANWGFARIEGIGWEWAGVIWLFSVITYIPLDILKFIIRYSLTGKAWDNLLQKKVNHIFFVKTLISFLFLFFFF